MSGMSLFLKDSYRLHAEVNQCVCAHTGGTEDLQG